MLNLFIGVIIDSMMDMKREVEEKNNEAKAWAVATRLTVKDEKQEKGAASGDGDKLGLGTCRAHLVMTSAMFNRKKRGIYHLLFWRFQSQTRGIVVEW